MKWLKNNYIQVLLTIVNVLLIVGLMLACYEVPDSAFTTYAPSVLGVVLPIILISIGIMGLVLEKKFPYVILILVGAGILYINAEFSIKLLESQVNVVNTKLGNSETLYYKDFSIISKYIAMFLTILSMMCIYIYPWTVILIDVLFIGFLWAVDYLIKPQGKLLPFVFLWAIVFAHSRGIQTERDSIRYKEKRVSKNRRLLQVISIGLIIGYITSALLGFNKGIFYDKLWVKANDFLMEDEFMSGNKFLNAFSLKSSGYNDSSTKLGGDIKLDDNIVLSIKGDTPRYLRGNTKYEYTGKLWNKNTFVYKTENSASTEIIKSYKGAKVKKMTIIPKAIRTSSILVPSYPQTIVVSEKRPNLKLYYSVKDQTFVLDDITVEPYDVEYFDDLAIEKVANQNANANYTDEVGMFLQIPDSVTQRTKDLVSDLTRDLPTNEEKLKAIRDYIGSNYTYTLTPGDYPEDSDFVDYFLFESKKGYCVHYATAFTIMARIAGVPARYAEGYKIPNEFDQVTNEAIVKNEDGHAWTEVLIDGQNEIWTIWDATGSARDHSGASSNKDKTTTKPNTKPQEKPKEQTKPQNVTKPQVNQQNQNPLNNKLNSNLFKFLLIIPLILFIFLLMYLRKLLIKKKVLMDLNNEFLNHILPILGKIFGPLKDSQSYLDYIDSIDENSNVKTPKDFIQTMEKSPIGPELLSMADENKAKGKITYNVDENQNEIKSNESISTLNNDYLEAKNKETLVKDSDDEIIVTDLTDDSIDVIHEEIGGPITVELEASSISLDDEVPQVKKESGMNLKLKDENSNGNTESNKHFNKHSSSKDSYVDLNDYKSKISYVINENYAQTYGDYIKEIPMELKEEIYNDSYSLYKEKFGKLKGFIKKYFI